MRIFTFFSVIALTSACFSSAQAQLELPSAPSNISVLFNQTPALSQSLNGFNEDIIMPNVLPSGLPVYSTGSGAWNDGLNWDCGCAPGLIHEVHIQAGHDIEMTQDQVVESLILEPGSSLTIVSESETTVSLTLFNSLLNEGSIEASGAALILSGNLNIHHIAGTNEFLDVLCQSAGDVVLDGPLTVLGRVDLTSTTLESNGNLKLIAGNNDFHGIAEYFNSSIIGNIQLEKVITLPSNQYFNLSAGVDAASFEEWNDDLVTTGFPGSDYPLTTFNSIVRYDESQSDEANSYSPPGDVTDMIDPTQGFYIYSNAGEYTIDINGEAVHGAQHYNLTRTSQELGALEGFHFLGNPFAANIDRTIDAGWVRQDVAAAIYQWDHNSRQFGTYVQGIGVNGGDGKVEMMGTFWMQALADGASLQINENAKSSSGGVATEEENEVLMIAVSNGIQADEIALATAEGTSPAYDSEWDAQKLFSTNVIAELAWEAENSFPLAIQRTSQDLSNTSFPILLTAKEAGEFTLNISNQLVLNQVMCMALEDMNTGEVYPIDQELNFSFTSGVVTEENRFTLHFGAAVVSTSTMVTCSSDFDGEINVQGTGNGPWDYTWRNSEGLVIREMVELAGPDTHHNLAPGDYTITIGPNDYCESLEIQATVEAPAPINFMSNYENVGCGEENTGSIEVEVSGGVAPYEYNWSQGSTGNMIFNLAGGTYDLLLSDSNGCELNYSFEIEEAADVVADFDFSASTVALENGQAVVEFSNTSIGANNITWNFGDGNTSNNINNPVHIFTETGLYVVSLLASNDECSNQYQVIINVEESTGISELFEDNFIVIPTAEGWMIETNWAQAGPTEIDIYNLLGQSLIPTWRGHLGKDRIYLSTDNSKGAILIQMRRPQDSWITTIKRLQQ